ncbi:right-handed parallel beta-helix repeat-containing protein [uncultured Methanobrevibacter sp.]|uniref:right-handed parallel beta-helix repeat-containing protein n=1 Tax=uncultured Methanobrevibacter sp. TaxID=253161 RepID=UPI00262EE0B7|nr:right-handed parallel beta-helix repeat-containing protein [uncultured Methanobrevibacter sp.]
MKFKHVLLISFLLVILTVSAASAADINETSNDAIGIDMASSEVNGSDNAIFQSSANDDILATGEGSFSEVQTMINGASDGDTIVLSKDYLGSGTNILVNKEVTIDGNNATFDANCASRIFYVTSSNVVIKNINFINGNSTSSSYYDGGAIRWEGTNGTVLNCSFDNCSASEDGGGAIQWEGANGSVLNSHFMNCHAYDTGAIMWAGANGSVAGCIFENCFVTYYGAGAIEWYFKAANGQVYNCSFINCSSIWGSGAITYRSDNGSALNCTFTNCSGSSAGAIMCDSAYVEGCSFVNCNSPTGEAGAIIWFDDGGYISNCSFVNCYYGNHPYSNSGGVVDIWNENQVISNCKFESDYNDDFNIPIRGGVISNCTVNGISVTSFEYLQSLINNSTDTLIIGHDYYSNGNHIIISKNITIDGAGHTLDGNELSRIFEITAENVTLKNIVFKNGYSDGYGGAVYFTGNGNVTNCNFNDNKANGYYSMGGAIWMSSGTVTDCNFANNYVSFEGGAIWMYSGTVTNCNFANNTAPDKGGAVAIHDEGNFTNCSFTDNKATGDYGMGGAVYFTDDSSGSLIDCNFTNNTATVFGGAIYLDHSSTAKAVNCNFIKNSAKQDGGAIYVHETCTATVTNCNFTNNTASSNGGAVYFGNTGTITNCNFTNNSASESGGAVYFTGNGNVTNCNFTNNTASSNGGAVYFNSFGSVTNCNFYDNKVTDNGNGGAFYFFQSTESHVTNCNFINNKAATCGAFLMGFGSVTNCNFINNTATNGNGGAVYLLGDSIVANCNFTNNTASEYGGAIAFEWACNVTNCSFTNNSAGYGGAIKMYSGNVTNCNLTNNSARFGGGAVYSRDDGKVTNCNFTNNAANGDGGAVYLYNAGNVTNCNFINNKATGGWSSGGAVYFRNGGKVTNCNFTNNQASADGGAVCFGGIGTVTSNGNVANSNFINNTASRYGGAVYFGSEGSVTNCKFSISNSGFDINNSTSLETVIFRGTLSNCTINGEPVNTINDTKFETRTILSVNATHLSIGEKISIIADVLNETNVNGSVDVFINGILIETVNSGVKYVHVPNEIGTYSIMAKFKGDANYTQSQSANKTFTVGPKVSIEQNVSVGENGRVEMEFDKNITDILVIKIDGDTFAVADIDEGIVNCTISTSKLTARNHTVTFAYERSLFDANVLNYFDESTKQYLPVEYEMYLCPKTSSQDTEVKNNNTVIMQVGENATGVVKVFVNGAEVMIVEIVNGIAIIDLSAYKDGNYDITFVYSGDDIYEGFTMEIELKNPKISAKNTNALYTAGQKYSVTVYDREGNPVKGAEVIFKIGKKQVGKANTDTKGVATYKVTNVPGSYKITATALGASTTKTLTVKHLVTLKSVTVKRSAKKLVLQATLAKVNKKYLKNKKITFKFNGKTYTAKTNKKGVAKVTIKSTVLKKLKVGKKVTYQATYLKDTVKKTAKIKK